METLIENFNRKTEHINANSNNLNQPTNSQINLVNQYSSSSEIFLYHDYSQVNPLQQNEEVQQVSAECSQNSNGEQAKSIKKNTYEVLLEQKQQEMVRQYLEEIRVLERQLWDMQNRQSNKQKTGVTENIFDKILTMKIGNTSQTCSICFNGFAKDEIIKKLPCKHIFHLSCIKPWLKKQKTCPNCRDDICDSLKQQEQKKNSKRQNICTNDLGEKLQKKETESKRQQKSFDSPKNVDLNDFSNQSCAADISSSSSSSNSQVQQIKLI